VCLELYRTVETDPVLNWSMCWASSDWVSKCNMAGVQQGQNNGSKGSM